MIQQSNKALHEQARDFFITNKYHEAKEVITKVNPHCKSTQMNKLLIDLELSNREDANEILKKLLNMLTEINIQLYQNNRPKRINFISHEKLYLNIIALSRYIGIGGVTQLVGLQSLFFSKSMKTTTVLPIIYECLKRFLNSNRMHTSMEILQKFHQILTHARNLTSEQEKYKSLIYALFIRTLLKLGIIEQSQSQFMLNFGENEKEKFEESKKKIKSKFNFEMVMNFLHAEIALYDDKPEKSIGILSEIMMSSEGKYKVYAENNLGIIFSLRHKGTSAQRVLVSSCQSIYKLISQAKKVDPGLQQFYARSKENIFLAQINSRNENQLNSHFRIDADQKTYNHMKHLEDLVSYKHQYRRGQCCINLYHSTLQKSQRKLPWQEIHDNYDNVYYHPNVPYHQFKGKNKNIHLANKKAVYRRFVLNEWNNNPDQEQVDKDFNRRKFEKQAASIKLKSLLAKAEQAFKKALIILEKEQQIVLNLQSLDKQLTKRINQKLFHQIAKYRSSILCLLTYVCLCQCRWGEAIQYAQIFSKRKCYENSSEDFYSVLTYQVQAYCELNRMDYAYETFRRLINENSRKNENNRNVFTYDCRDSSNISNCIFEYNQSQTLNFLYNFAVLNLRTSRIPDAHQNIQNLYGEMNISKYPRSDLPLPVLELLIYYNLRIKNTSDALEIIKRRGIIGNAMAAMNKPILAVTK